MLAVAGLILIGGVGHAFLFGEHAPADPKPPALAPSACDDAHPVDDASISLKAADVAMLEVLYSRQCHLYWAQIRPVKLRGSLEVTIGVTDRNGSTSGKVKGRLTKQALWSIPVTDDGLCHGAAVDLRTSDGKTTSISTGCN